VTLSSNDATYKSKLLQSSSIKLIPIWGSLDGSVAYLTGSAIYAYPAQRGATSLDPKRFVVTVHEVRDTYRSNEETVLRVNIFDHTSPLVKASRLPVEQSSLVVRDVHYQVRDDVTGNIEIPFDLSKNSTRCSSDASGMYFRIDTSNLTVNRSYVIDVMIITGNNRQTYLATSPVFRVSDLR
jgi:hypothetical protein